MLEAWLNRIAHPLYFSADRTDGNFFKRMFFDLKLRTEVLVLGPIWGALHEYYLSGLIWASPYLWITVFWGLNWVFGSSLALASPPPLPGEEDKRFSARKFAKSPLKLIIWVVALLVATGLRRVNIAGGWIPAGAIELGVVLTEGVYLLRNLGRIAEKIGNSKQAAMLGFAADRTEEFMDSRVHTHTTVQILPPETSHPDQPVVTVTETIVTTTNSSSSTKSTSEESPHV